MIRTILTTLLLGAALTAAAQHTPSDADLKQAQKLEEKAGKLMAKGKAEKAWPLYEEAAALGLTSAQRILADHYLETNRTDAARKLITNLAENGEPRAILQMANWALADEDYDVAIDWLDQIAYCEDTIVATEAREMLKAAYTMRSKAYNERLGEWGTDNRTAKLASEISASLHKAEETEEIDPSVVYTVVEQSPQFPGGKEALLRYIATHIKYPATALKYEIQGLVVLQFVVNEDGSVSDVKVIQSLYEECDLEAARVAKSLPCFIPGKQMGQPVKAYYTLPVRFQLQKRQRTRKHSAAANRKS